MTLSDSMFDVRHAETARGGDRQPHLPRPADDQHESDYALMRRVQCDDMTAFACLYDRHVARALRLAGSVLSGPGHAEDVVQEGFLAIWRSRASFRPEAGSFQGWAMRIIRNRAIDDGRRDAARPQAPAGPADHTLDEPSWTLADAVVARSEAEAVRCALARLPPAQAEVIGLAYYGELSHSEIARRLALPSGTIKGRMRLGLEKLARDPELARRNGSESRGASALGVQAIRPEPPVVPL